MRHNRPGSHEGPYTRPADVVQSHFNGCIAATAWQRGDAQALLPSELKLDDKSPDQATVIFLIGEQSRCAAMLGQVPVVASTDYLEMLIAVAGVRHPDAPAPFVYVAHGYSTSALTVFNGNHFYGFAKQAAHICWQEPFYLVTDRSQRLLWQAQVGLEGNGNDSLAWQNLQRVFEAPILGRTARGSFVVSYFDWYASPGSYRSAAVRMCHEGIDDKRVEQREWTSLPQAGIRLDGLRWRLSWPTPL
ncbi:MAG TPA: hypothetical protein VMT89_12545 [Candidatus Acidoferrales bacterium]|nr:hypothetical protein [Candidatus Acidoferrales bacterium]